MLSEYKRMPVAVNPHGDFNCRRCKHWNRLHLQKAVPIDGQWVPLAQLIGAGTFDRESMMVEDVAPCTLQPLWITMRAEHWCGQFEGERSY